jgi:xanthine dehydrogenase accessory factor
MRKVKHTLSELQNEGISATKLDKLFTPIGLNISSDTPAEIAISILAELINVRRTGKPSRISLKKTIESGYQMEEKNNVEG